jgi:hypothetical protein
MKRILTVFTMILLAIPALAKEGYFPENSPQAGGMKNQVLFYNLNSASERGRSRMPWLSADGKSLYFVVGKEGEESLWFSLNSAGQWLAPSPLDELNLKGYSTQSPCLTPDGKKLYFTSNRPAENSEGWRIYFSEKNNKGQWGIPQSIEVEAAPGVTLSAGSSAHDYAVFLSRDGKTLWFTSNREGGQGGYDIWKSVQNAEGRWLTPVNPCEPLNSPADEKAGVCISADNQTVYFASDREKMNEDTTDFCQIYRAELDNTPRGLKAGEPVRITGLTVKNTAKSSIAEFPCLSADGKTLYYSGRGPLMWLGDELEIYQAEIKEGKAMAPRNLGRFVNNIHWYKDEDYLPYVAYLDDSTYEPTDWMFDSGLFLGYGGSSSGQDYGWGKSVKDDWTDYLNAIFMPHRQLHKLDEVIGNVKIKLNDPDYQMKVAIMIPCANATVTDFGDIDGDGVSEDLTLPGNRLKTEKWYLNELLNRWQAANLKNIKLVAIYWMKEDVKKDKKLVQEVAKIIHQKGLKFEWIPYFKADYADWKEYGFDFVEYQPNYAWMIRKYWGESPDPNQLAVAARRAREKNMGMEMEFDGRVFNDGANLRAYLDYGALNREGYMGNCLTGYYQEVYTLAKLGYSSSSITPWARDAYENIYSFIKDTYPVCLSYQKKYSYNRKPSAPYADDSLQKLNDYRFLPDILGNERVVGFKGVDPVITYDLGNLCRVNKVYAHLQGGNVEGISYPKEVRVEISKDGKEWMDAGSTHLHPEEHQKLVQGDMLVKFAPLPARYVRITLKRNSTWVCVDELQVYGTPLLPEK